MSALRPLTLQEAPKRTWNYFAFVPLTDICTAANSVSFDHLVGDGEHAGRNCQAERLGGLELAAATVWSREVQVAVQKLQVIVKKNAVSSNVSVSDK
jgi:hypothetical protein